MKEVAVAFAAGEIDQSELYAKRNEVMARMGVSARILKRPAAAAPKALARPTLHDDIDGEPLGGNVEHETSSDISLLSETGPDSDREVDVSRAGLAFR